jgi:hypothetical protein
VKQFADSYDQLINGIAEKVDALHGRLTAQRR